MGRGLALALYINRLRFSWSTQQDGFSAGLRCMILAKGRVAAYYTAPDMTAEYCDKRVCMCFCVCLSATISSERHVRSSPIFCECYLWPWVGPLLTAYSDTLCTSGFMDDVMFAHKPRWLDVAAQLKRSGHAALSLTINCAQ